MSKTATFPWLGAIALLFSFVGFVAPPAALIAMVLGAVAFKKAASPRSRELGRAAVAVSGVGLLTFAGLLWFRERSTSSEAVECQVGLEALDLAQEAHRKTRGRYASKQEELGIPVAETYFLEASGEHQAELEKLKVGPSGQCPACSITMACVERPSGRWWTITTGAKAVVRDSF